MEIGKLNNIVFRKFTYLGKWQGKAKPDEHILESDDFFQRWGKMQSRRGTEST